ncbi:BgTH12-05340 [Blumeria graminis f. sp. triticale]|nr:BgTH12-05340 [Blumeria graminis f. sp. triticale]
MVRLVPYNLLPPTGPNFHQEISSQLPHFPSVNFRTVSNASRPNAPYINMFRRVSPRAARLMRGGACHEMRAPFATSRCGLNANVSTTTSDLGQPALASASSGKPSSSCRPLQEATYRQLPSTMQKMSLMGKVVIVTGGARGLGYNMAEACVEAGAKAIIILDTNTALGEAAVKALLEATNNSVAVAFYNVDVRSEEDINRSMDELTAAHGVPDVLINSAGIADSNMPAETYDTKLFSRLIDINLNGSFLMAQALGKRLIEAKKPGSIVFIASMSGGIVNYPQEQSCYNASKAGVIMLGKSLAAEWAKFGIRVNMISPGYMDTALNNVPALDAQKKIWKALTPQSRLGAVHDLNGLAVLLASDSSAFMTGSNIIIDGGYTLY